MRVHHHAPCIWSSLAVGRPHGFYRMPWMRGCGASPQTPEAEAGRDFCRDFCCVKSRTADSARLITGVSPGRSWNFASRGGPLVTAVVRWSMPQLCPKIPTLAYNPYVISRGAGRPPADPGAPNLSAVRALSPTAISRDRAPTGQDERPFRGSGDGHSTGDLP